MTSEVKDTLLPASLPGMNCPCTCPILQAFRGLLAPHPLGAAEEGKLAECGHLILRAANNFTC